jgi:hypothetical protein
LTTRTPVTIRGGGDPRQAWLARRLREWACRLGALPPMRMTASWSGSARNPPNTSVWRDRARPWRAPLGSSFRLLPAVADATASRKARLTVHRPSACSGVKALRNTSYAKAASRKAALASRSLDPFRALREPDRRRRDEERPFPVGSRTGAPVGRGIPTVPRFQPPPRRTQHADFPHCAPPFASRQGLWDLSYRGNFRSVVSHSIAVEQP